MLSGGKSLPLLCLLKSYCRNPNRATDQENCQIVLRRSGKRCAGGTILGISMVTSAIAAGGLVGLALSFRNLPDVRVLRNYVPAETSYVYDIKGRLLTSLHGEANRENVTIDQMSPELKLAVVANRGQ